MFGKGSKKSAGGSGLAKANKDKYAASTISEKEAQRNSTSLQTFINASKNVYAEVIAIKVVVHTTGSTKTHDGRSGNHWSIFLILAGEEPKSVRLNMMTDGLGDYGHFEVTDKTYHNTKSRLRIFDYPAVPRKTVFDFLDVVTGNGRERYLMSGTGNGCRFWVWNVFNDILRCQYIALPNYQNVAGQLYQHLQLKYHQDRAGKIHTAPSEMEAGQFLA